MELNIDIILADLKDGKVPRTQQSLDKLNGILQAYAEAGQRDFSITQIGRISAAEGGPGYESIRATNNKHLLKQHANITIDKRPVRQFDAVAEQTIQVLPAFSNILTESEKQALAYAISDKCMEDHGWETTLAGQVKDMECNTEIFPRGFITGLRKILGEVDK